MKADGLSLLLKKASSDLIGLNILISRWNTLETAPGGGISRRAHTICSGGPWIYLRDIGYRYAMGSDLEVFFVNQVAIAVVDLDLLKSAGLIDW